jgi:hypothetical protein
LDANATRRRLQLRLCEWENTPQRPIPRRTNDSSGVSIRPGTREPREEAAVGWGHLTVQHSKLMSENEDLSVLGAVASTAKHEEIQHEADKRVGSGGHGGDVGKPGQIPSDQAERCVSKARTSFRHPHGRSLPRSHVDATPASTSEVFP